MNEGNQFWWQIDDETEMGNLLTGLIEQLKDDHRPRHNNNLDMLRMYTGRENDRNRLSNIRDDRMRLNVVGNITDTLVSRLGKAKPKPSSGSF